MSKLVLTKEYFHDENNGNARVFRYRWVEVDDEEEDFKNALSEYPTPVKYLTEEQIQELRKEWEKIPKEKDRPFPARYYKEKEPTTTTHTVNNKSKLFDEHGF